MLNFISAAGLLAMVGLAWLLSSHKKKVSWRLVVMGLGLQLVLAAFFFNSQSWTYHTSYATLDELNQAVADGNLDGARIDAAIEALPDEQLMIGTQAFANYESILESIDSGVLSAGGVDQALAAVPGGISIPHFQHGVLFAAFDTFFAYVNEWVNEGASFVFNVDPGRTNEYTHTSTLLTSFAFGVLPTVIFFAALMSVLYHIGLMQRLVFMMAWVMRKTLGISGAESLAAAANVFVGHTEAPLVVKPYIAGMTQSELNALMVGGFATITGGLMAVFVAQGISAGHLVVASIVSAPAALVIAKILQPETEQPESAGDTLVRFDSTAANVIDAAATGARDGMKLAINIAAMLIAFLALIAMVDTLLLGLGNAFEWIINRFASQAVDLQWSLNGLLALVFWPFAFLMGIETADCSIAGELLGTKMVVNEFLAYFNMGAILAGEVTVTQADGTQTIVAMSHRTEVILTYALCGFSNFGAIAIQLGGIGPLAPERRGDLAKFGLRAMFGGMLACCMTACIAGMFYGLI